MIDVLILAIALSMDAFAVSLTLGARKLSNTKKIALLAALYFGLFQGLMPLFGYFGGIALLSLLGTFTHWVAFLLLLIIGVKMIYEATKHRQEKNVDALSSVSHYSLFILAIATSIDALAAGFSLTLMPVNGIHACLVIGFITFMFSYFGVILGRKTTAWIGNKAEIVGGVVLILLGFKILIL